MKVINVIDCECRDDFYTQMFNLTKSMGRSVMRAELMGQLVKEERLNGKFYLTFKEDDWAIYGVISDDDFMEHTYECEFFKDKDPQIKEIRVSNGEWIHDNSDGWEYISKNGNHYDVRTLDPFGSNCTSMELGCFKLKELESGEGFTYIDKFIDWVAYCPDHEEEALDFLEDKIIDYENSLDTNMKE